MNERDQVQEALGGFQPEVVLVLGSGLGDVARRITVTHTIAQSQLPGVPTGNITGHRGEVLCGTMNGCRTLVLAGRLHLYEGHSLAITTRALRHVLALRPALVVLTNAAGAIQRDFRPGELMLLSDHINLCGASPLEGAHDPTLGPRFPDMSTVYSLSARQALRKAAEAQGITLKEGVYAMLRGPQYETPAEIRMLRLVGADAVGMSTVPEAIVCAAAAVPVVGISMLSNLAAGLSRTPLRHEEVLAVGARAATALGAILEAGLADAVAAVRSEP
jgi:purine-nucleoside phosphorylase